MFHVVARGLLSAALVLSLTGACLAGPVETYGLVFVCDGARGDVFYDYAVNGYKGKPLLPNIKKYFIDGGAWVREATGVFPTITGAGMPSALTGCYPGTNDMPSLYFFSRKEKKYPVLYVIGEAFDWDKYLSPNVKTIWEHFPGPNDAISFGPALHRGSDQHVSILWNAKYKPMEIRAKLRVSWRDLQRKVAGGLPARLTVVYNGWFDHMEHGKGARSESLIEDYANVDRQVGEAMDGFLEMVEARKKAGANVRYFASLVSDHGHQDIKKVIGIDDFIRNQKGARVLDKVWRRLFGFNITGDLPKDFSPYDLVVASGEGHALLYFPRMRPGEFGRDLIKDWDMRPSYAQLRKYPYRGETIDIIATAVQSPAVNFLTAKDFDKNIVHVFGKAGEATIERRREDGGWFYRYKVATGQDPLGFATGEKTKALVNGEFHSGRDWQLATLRTEFPDAPVMLFQVFDSTDRSADLFLSAMPFVSIGDLVDGDKSKSKHGGLTKDEAWATLAFHGSGITPGEIETARNVDMVPTMLSLMGQDYDASKLDGEPVVEVLERVNESRGASMGPERVAALRAAVNGLVAELSKAGDSALPARAAALATLLNRPGLPAREVRAARARAYQALARRGTPAAKALLRGERPSEFLARRRDDLKAPEGPAPADPAAVAALSAQTAEAAYRRIFSELQTLFERGDDPAGPQAREPLARVDALIQAVTALHDAGYPLPAPKLSFDTYRDGVNLWLEGVESGAACSSGTTRALGEYVRIERARANGTVRRAFFNKNKALVQVAVGERLQRLAAALARPPAGKAGDPRQLAAAVPAGETRDLLLGLATLEAPATRGVEGSGGSRELDEIYRNMGAR